MKRLFALAFLGPSACVQAADESSDCNCVEVPTDESWIAMSGFAQAAILSEGGERLDEGGIIETTDEMSLADTGFPLDAVMMTRSETLDDGTTLRAVQYDTVLATPGMIAASPAALCAAFDLTLVSSRSFAPTPPFIDLAGTAVTEAICT